MRRPERFTRKAFEVDAMRVTVDNMAAVSNWCGGRVVSGITDHVEFKAAKPNYGGIGRAHPGDWVIWMGTGKGFKVYRDKQFRDAFKPQRTNSMKFEEILNIVKEAMRKQDTATYLGVSGDTGNAAQEAALRILKITQ